MANEEIPAKQRRLDSLAWLIKGESACGAVCFDGEQLLVAKNCNSEHGFISSLFEFLAAVGDEAAKLMKKEKGSKSYERACTRFKEMYREGRQRLAAEARKVRGVNVDEVYKERIETCLRKVTRSIRKAYLDEDSDKAFEIEVAEAIRGKNYRFVRVLDAEGVHAEMKIVGDLLARKKINQDESWYIGISKKCCKNCEHVIQAVNVVKGSNVQNIIKYRSNHKNSYRSAIPPFLQTERNKAIKNEFLKLVNLETLEEAFHAQEDGDNHNRENHSRSSSHYSSESWNMVKSKRKHKAQGLQNKSGEWKQVSSKNGQTKSGFFNKPLPKRNENHGNPANRRPHGR